MGRVIGGPVIACISGCGGGNSESVQGNVGTMPRNKEMMEVEDVVVRILWYPFLLQ
jgi:hypothetical protein